MRICVLSFALLSAIAAFAQQHDDDMIIELHRAGPVSIGADAQAVYASFPRDRRKLIDLELEGHLSPALALTIAGSDVRDGLIAELAASDEELVVWRIQVHDPTLRTAEGIGVGSTIGELREAYEISGVTTGEGRLFVTVEDLSASFELDRSRYGFERLWRIRNPDAIPSDVEIASILLFRRPRPDSH